MLRSVTVITFCIVFSFVSYSVFSQNVRTLTLPVEKAATVDPNFLRLEEKNSWIRKDSFLNEQLVDMVKVEEMDSILPSRYQHHRFGIGWFLFVAGYKWRAIEMHRMKLVGTAKGDVYPPSLGSDQFTEYDVNIDLLPHTPKYVDMMYEGYVTQKTLNKHWKREHRKPEFDKTPFVYPVSSTLNQYRVHCELTPPKPYRILINERFYPDIAGTNFSNHPNFGEPRPTLGMYGAFVSDCNHTCHDEMHPYEWLYWLDVNPAKDSIANTKRWMVGLFREGSNRFRRWSYRPRVGSVAVPFIFPVGEGKPAINIDHLVYSEFMPKQFKQYQAVPADASDLNFTDMTVTPEGINQSIAIHTSIPMTTDALRMWFSDVKSDGKWVWGYIHLAMSVKDLYTARVTTSY